MTWQDDLGNCIVAGIKIGLSTWVAGKAVQELELAASKNNLLGVLFWSSVYGGASYAAYDGVQDVKKMLPKSRQLPPSFKFLPTENKRLRITKLKQGN
jgi:hypothetical protein